MSLSDLAEQLRPEILRAFERKGYTELTSVQRVVLDPATEGRDLRITSQTGSGKTVAIGLTLRGLPLHDAAAAGAVARPRAIVIAPTRELANQVEQELSWLYADCKVSVASTTGGASYRTEQRAFSRGPGIVVGTPGRLLDHLRRGTIDPSQVGALVLDEADRMLELGFREDLEAIIERMPTERTTHLVSATFPRALSVLADRIQRNPKHVQGTSLGVANTDIDHVIHIVDPAERGAAIINILLANPEDQTVIFVRTRADAGELAALLQRSGFPASALSGDMEQMARNRALAAFRQGELRILVATDVAARGIDVQGVTRVVHAEPPTDPDGYTHRSGRTGRAGRKGISALLIAPSRVVHASRLLRGLGVEHRFEPIPTPEQIMQAQDERLLQQLTAADEGEAVAEERFLDLARRLMQHGSLEQCLARLLARTHSGAQPRAIRNFPERLMRDRDRGPAPAPRGTRDFVPFRVSWGRQRGADVRRLLAMVCRRGDIRGTDVGAIRIEQHSATVGVDRAVADAFERAVSRPDPREPTIQIRREPSDANGAEASAPPRRAKPRGATKPVPVQPGKPRPAKRPQKRSHTA